MNNLLPLKTDYSSAVKVNLFKPYLDLSDASQCSPLHSWRPVFAYRALEEDNFYFRLQRTLPLSFRNSLMASIKHSPYYIKSIHDLPKELRTERWEQLCDLVTNYEHLSQKQKAFVSNILNTLGLFDLVLSLNQSQPNITELDDALLSSTIAVAKYVQFLDGFSPDYSLDLFKNIAVNAPKNSVIQFSAILHMIVQNARFQHDIEAVEYWSACGLTCLKSLEESLDPFQFAVLFSRFYRGASFAGFMKNDKERVVAEMEQAELYATIAFSHIHENNDRDIIWKENFYPLMESRSKEAVWIGDKDLAEKRIRRVIEIDAYDAKIWIELAELLVSMERIRDAAEAYHRATRLGPPGREVAWFMAGQCHEALNEPETAANCYLSSLGVDPLGVSAVDKLRELSKRQSDPSLIKWSA